MHDNQFVTSPTGSDTAVSAADLPLVTIVTPSYNQGRFIKETIESVLTQDYPNIEYIIMDGASTDETAEVVSAYAGRLTFISEKDRGQSHAINKGFRLARGSIVAWLNSDDIYLPGAVRHAVDAFLADPEAGAVYGEGFQIDIDGNILCRFAETQAFNLWRLLHLSDFILQQTSFFRKSVFDEIGFLDESLHYGMDWEIFMRIGLQYPIVYVPHDMGAIREYAAAKSFSGGEKRLRELLGIMRRHSGTTFPPGYFVYGVTTWEGLWHKRFQRYLPAPVAKKAGALLSRTLHRIAGRLMQRSQGLYSDGWATRKAKFVLPPPKGRHLEAHLVLPEWSDIGRQTVTFSAHGRSFARESFGLGEFVFPIEIPREFWNEPLHLVLHANRQFTEPAAEQIALEPRRMSYAVKSLRYAN